tara:strand:- start:106 stop:546 length:441 start_codon:yes stop_codon:yes gene_type:complete
MNNAKYDEIMKKIEIRDNADFFYDEIKFIEKEIEKLDKIPWDSTNKQGYCYSTDNSPKGSPTNDAKYYIFYFVEKDEADISDASKGSFPPERIFYTGKTKTAQGVLRAVENHYFIEQEFGPFIFEKKDERINRVNLEMIIKKVIGE